MGVVKLSDMEIKGQVSMVLCGPAGMGIQTVESLLTKILKQNGYNVFATPEYMSRVRGGMNSTEIRVADRPVRAFTKQIDVLVPLARGAVEHTAWRMTDKTVILGDLNMLGDEVDTKTYTCCPVPLGKIAEEIGNKVFSNIVAVGVLAALLGIQSEQLADYIRRFFRRKTEDIVEKNIAAVKAGHEYGSRFVTDGTLQISIASSDKPASQMFLSGTEAVGLGALTGGCNFVSSYPMSPSTGVLAYMAKQSNDFGLVVEQAEDEIAAVNMALGAWYAGARAMATTSGGGFALMCEGISLAGIIESPLVVHLAQRPGPATGLPTRTEQGDLELALYAGHGEFPRILLAPGTLQEAFTCTAQAFNLADKYQVPVFILTDQYLLESLYNTDPFDVDAIPAEKHFIETAGDYQRFKGAENGLSPRGIPGRGKGLVCVDSDEHDESGHITEDRNVRIAQNEKRLRKMNGILQDVIEPTLWPDTEYKNLVLCWGSTFPIVAEALARLDRKDTSLLHYSQIYPLHPEMAGYLDRAEKTIVLEGNATGQFAKLIKLHTGVEVDHRILKYDGFPFSVEDVVEQLTEILS
ncbi:MAG: 2-oxoacid:acceptor oxidoreductase subunit alpha [Sedimentisphaerales bacterium]|nr:2-oxoacid:acceptor oxidoreductase subunit alpha [Sedimentisphaerales bacterium]